MNVADFKAYVASRKHLHGAKMKEREDAIDAYWESAGDLFDNVGVPHRIIRPGPPPAD
ncbi:hypothetical protein [Rhizobium sp. BK176]|uniref:hypothetical protein n=1 Tax=Rhizobium sp. BK176 TaxID=2587071 RepID=UPI0021673F3A|nr:hypothetical protein [Rhizobium sp. BK176]MCS4088835.1 hypothetical protein [Rhizobium sp. BK176]